MSNRSIIRVVVAVFAVIFALTFMFSFALSQGLFGLRAANVAQLTVDQNRDGFADPGDVIEYNVQIANCGDSAQTGLNYRSDLDPNTGLVPGSVEIGAVQPATGCGSDPGAEGPGTGATNTPEPGATAVPTATLTPTPNADAVDDSFNVSNGASTADNVLLNDNGTPPLTVLSFGDSLATVGSVPADGASVLSIPAGGGTIDITIDSVGAISITSVGTTGSGSITIYYQIEAANATIDAAAITISHGDFPVAVDDTNATLGGAAYETTINTTLNVPAATGLLNNDSLGAPAAVVTLFGGGDASGAVDLPAGSPVSLTGGGSLTVFSDGSFSFTPSPGQVGVFAFSYTIDNGLGASTADVEINILEAPTANADTHQVSIGAVDSAYNVLSNDNPGTPPATVTNFGGGTLGGSVGDNAAGAVVAIPGSGGITVSIAADGTLTVDATAVGAIASSYTVDYLIDNGTGTSTATVTINVVQGPVAQDDVFILLVSGTLNGNLTADNGSGADVPGVPPYDTLTFGGGNLGGAVTTNAAPTSVTLAGGTLTVNLDGTFSLASPTQSGLFTFQYRLTSTVLGVSDDATVSISILQAPTAFADGTYTVQTGGTLSITAADPNDLLDNDTLGFEAATISSFGGGDLGGSVVSYAAGATAPLAGGTLTVFADGGFTFSNPTAAGIYTFQYRLSNTTGFSDATVTVEVRQGPVAQDDAFNMLVAGTLNGNLTADNGAGTDLPGIPPYNALTFGGGDLGGTITSNSAPTSATLAGGTLTINLDGTFSLVNPTQTGIFTFQYRLSNAIPASDDATVTIEIREAPSAVADGTYTVQTGATLTIATGDPNDLLDNDDLGFPLASITSFGGGDLGGTVLTNAAGDSVPLAGGTLTVNADGSFTFSSPSAAGTYTFNYRLTNTAGTSDATVTIEVRQGPVAQDDAFTMLVTGTLNGDLTVDNGAGADLPGVPPYNALTFGGGDLGGTITSSTAPTSATLAGGTLTINLDGTFSLVNPNQTGIFTFQYRLSNAIPASDDATVTIEIQQAPDAIDDGGYVVTAGNTLVVATADPNDLLDNDDLGFPLAAVASFGGGSTGGTVTTTAAGSTLTPIPGYPDGSLVVSANGGFTLTAPATFCGTFTFSYRLTNAAGSDDATVTIDVQCAPNAVDDAAAGGSVPGNDYHTALNTTLTIANGSPQDLDANDNLGNPAGAISSFGAVQTVVQSGGSAGTFNAAVGTVTTNAAGSTLSPIPGYADGSLLVAANGAVTFTPPNGYTGLFRFQYRLTNSVGSDDAIVTLAVGERPVAATDTYPSNIVGNTPIDTTISSNFSVLTNDSGSSTTLSLVSSPNGTLTFNANGTFTFNPAAGYTGTSAATYSLTNGFGSVNGTLNLPVVGRIWYVNRNAGSAGDGRLGSPFQDLAGAGNTFDALAADAAGDSIFLYESGTNYTGGLALLNNQRLIGQDSTQSLAVRSGLTFPADSVPPVMNSANGIRATVVNAAGSGVTFSTGSVSVFGLTVGNTSASGISGGAAGSSLTVDDVSINGTGQILLLNASVACACDFDTLSTTSTSAVPAIQVTSGSGTLTATTTTISGVTAGHSILIDSSSLDASFGATTVSQTNGLNAVRLVNNTSASDIAFSTLAITTSTGGGLTSSEHAGSITVTTAAGSSISAAGGSAIDIVRASGTTTINLNFTSLITTATPQFGVRLQRTAGTGLIVTGNTSLSMAAGSTNGLLMDNVSAGTYNVSSSGTVTINDRRDVGILLNNVAGTSLNFGLTTVNNPASVTVPAIRVNNGTIPVTFAQTNVNMNSAGGNELFSNSYTAGDNSGDGDAIYINGYTGSGFTINGGTIQNAGDDGIDIRNSSNLSLNNVTIQSVGFSPTALTGACPDCNSSGLQAFNLTGTNTIANSQFRLGRVRNFYFSNTSGSSTLNVTGSTFFDTRSSPLSATDNLQIYTSGTASAAFTIANSTFTRSATNQIDAEAYGTSQITQLNITGNTLDYDGGDSSGIQISGLESSIVNFNIYANPTLRTQNENVITVDAGGNGFVQGRIYNNPNMFFNTLNQSVFNVIRVLSDGANSQVRILIEDNSITLNNGTDGINLSVQGAAAARIDAAVIDNTIVAVNTTGAASVPLEGINAFVNPTLGGTKILCLTFTDNDVSGIWARAARVRALSPTGVLMTNFTTDVATSWTNNGNTGSPVIQFANAGGTITGTGTCNAPTNPLP